MFNLSPNAATVNLPMRSPIATDPTTIAANCMLMPDCFSASMCVMFDALANWPKLDTSASCQKKRIRSTCFVVTRGRTRVALLLFAPGSADAPAVESSAASDSGGSPSGLIP